MFPRADLVITHGGHGTVITALACGVPVLCVPMGRDQADVAARVVWRGAGLRESSRAKPDALRRAVRRLLAEPHFRDAARRIADELARDDGTARAVAELEALGGAGRAPRVGSPRLLAPSPNSGRGRTTIDRLACQSSEEACEAWPGKGDASLA